MFTPITTARRKEGGRPREILSPPTKRSQDTNDYRIPAVWTRKPGIDHLERNVIILNDEWRGECLRFHDGCQRFLLFFPFSSSPFFFSLFKDTCLADCRRATSPSSSVSRSRDTIPAIAIVSVGIKGGISIRNRESAFARMAWMNLVDFILQIFLDNVRSWYSLEVSLGFNFENR